MCPVESPVLFHPQRNMMRRFALISPATEVKPSALLLTAPGSPTPPPLSALYTSVPNEPVQFPQVDDALPHFTS